ncbi:hypothetical protein M569_01161 [Genlisea aurea]|uniref:DUF4005 domain-containing protein n=1 Tax=Genlisea aurea TaxID=192259 RepID=S8ECC7_9LAMI|nr:hypothetical protein M569_01161 [Genlisea aurea]
MGRATRWLKGLLGFKTTETNRRKSAPSRHRSDIAGGEDERAIAVAEAAVAAAQAAAAVVRITSNFGVRAGRNREEWAAITVQSHFRAYLVRKRGLPGMAFIVAGIYMFMSSLVNHLKSKARKALRALRALVKLQALARGYIVRRQTAYILRRLQALVRAQSRVRSRVGSSESSMISSHAHHQGPATPEKCERIPTSRSFKYGGHQSTLKKSGSDFDNHRTRPWRSVSRSNNLDEDTTIKILQVDNSNVMMMMKNPSSHSRSSSRRVLYPPSYHDSLGSAAAAVSSPSSGEVQSLRRFEFSHYDNAYQGDSISPPTTLYSSSRGLLGTPAKSDGTRSCGNNTIAGDHPKNYMAYTQSSKAKVRSASAPKQRPPLERSCSASMAKRYSVYGNGDASKVMMQRGSVSRCYPGSGLLDRVGDDFSSSSSHWPRAV